MIRCSRISISLGLAMAAWGAGAQGQPQAQPQAASSGTLQLATFACDVTLPMGHPMVGGWIAPASAVDDPLMAKGIILRDGGGTYVLCAIDWCELRNKAYDLFRTRIAEAAGTSPSRVAVQCTHSHGAPLTDAGAQELLNKVKDPPAHADLAFLDTASQRVAAAVREAARHGQDVTEIGTGKAKVERVASARRILQPDGTALVRYSFTKDQKIREASEGQIDPWLRTVSFFHGDKPIACLHYYASHPQTHAGDGHVTKDTVGLARERFENETKVFQVYFTGCGGNVTVGKYNDNSPECWKELSGRVYDAMTRSVAATQRIPVEPIQWRVRPVRLPQLRGEKYAEKTLRKAMEDPKSRPVDRIQSAMWLAWLDRLKANQPIDFTCMAIGPVRIVHLPGESFLEYQLYAEDLAPDKFVAVAAYGDCGPGYICLEKSFAEGGYEPTQSLVAPAGERYMKTGIADLLSDAPARKHPVLRDVRKIWDAAPHCAFTDLLRHHDTWFCTFREGAKHVSEEGAIRVITSPDGQKWESAALLTESGADLRDPKLSVMPDGRLMLLGGRRTWPPKHEPTLQSWVAFSDTGSTWTRPQRILDEGQWLWRATWHGKSCYGVVYGLAENYEGGKESYLHQSADGLRYTKLATFSAAPRLTEATLRFAEDDTMYCLHRRDSENPTALIGRSQPPYTQWSWHDSGFYFGGPDAVLHEGTWWAAGRWMVGPAKTVLTRIDWTTGTLDPVLDLPSGGDSSYPRLVSQRDGLWMSYYSSHEGTTAIYLARVAFE